ncbi:response regulator [Roseateles koreensis]|uniref:Response regulator transcription factor n=1 Tax=Roseateles koreensis TaxID=2987526 RepID=A0ABT5KN86_9BURK|nr:response regulator transcription factor [Roseateles koreensis]MDC8784306.1 response regulator transcription factor [Roseateles koreensis]
MRVLLIDDHPLILSALKVLIEGFDKGIQVELAESAAEARQMLQTHQQVDLVLLDLQLGDANGFDVLDELRLSYPDLPVVVISGSELATDAIRAIDQGAMGFIPKRHSCELLAQALQLVMSGGIYVPALNLDDDAALDGAGPSAAPSFVRGCPEEFLAPSAQTRIDLASLSLTRRQTDVLALLLQGKPNKLIARDLGLSVETIKDHVAAVLKALGVGTRTQAVLAVGLRAHPAAGPLFLSWKRDPS